jgi:hypothetical protein
VRKVGFKVDVPEREKDLPFLFRRRHLHRNPLYSSDRLRGTRGCELYGDSLEDHDDVLAGGSCEDERNTIDVNATHPFERVSLQPWLLFLLENLTNTRGSGVGGGTEGHLVFHYLSDRSVMVGRSVAGVVSPPGPMLAPS